MNILIQNGRFCKLVTLTPVINIKYIIFYYMFIKNKNFCIKKTQTNKTILDFMHESTQKHTLTLCCFFLFSSFFFFTN